LLRNSFRIGMIFLPYLMMRRVEDQNQHKGHGQVDYRPTTLDTSILTNISYTVIILKRRLVTVEVHPPSSVIVILAIVQIVTVLAAVAGRQQKSIKQIQHQQQTVL
jgi:hypothetical protein